MVKQLTPERERQIMTAFSTRFASLLAAGTSVPDAFDSIMGPGAYTKLAGELYDELRARAGVR